MTLNFHELVEKALGYEDQIAELFERVEKLERDVAPIVGEAVHEAPAVAADVEALTDPAPSEAAQPTVTDQPTSSSPQG